MATAKATQLRTPRTVTLKLTEGEADLIYGLMGWLSGHPSKSPLKYARRIEAALRKALGYEPIDTDVRSLAIGHIQLFEYDNHPELTDADRVMAILESRGFQMQADWTGNYDAMIGFEKLLTHMEERSEVS